MGVEPIIQRVVSWSVAIGCLRGLLLRVLPVVTVNHALRRGDAVRIGFPTDLSEVVEGAWNHTASEDGEWHKREVECSHADRLIRAGDPFEAVRSHAAENSPKTPHFAQEPRPV